MREERNATKRSHPYPQTTRTTFEPFLISFSPYSYLTRCYLFISTTTNPLPPLRYLYLRNTRDNHAPLPTYLYSQLYSDAWSYQPNENEIITSIGEAPPLCVMVMSLEFPRMTP